MRIKECKILLAEDDVNLGFIIKDNLEMEGYIVDVFSNGEEALNALENSIYQLCILDIMMPIKNGYEVAESIRSKNEHLPIIFLSAKTQKEDKLTGFNIGADDYITKPFSIEELLMRIKVFLKRSQIESNTSNVIINIGDYVFNTQNFDLICKNYTKKLTLKEAELLKLLIKNINQTVKREEILLTVWGSNDYFIGRSMDVFISRLRKYLSLDSNLEISNYHGIGFKLSLKTTS